MEEKNKLDQLLDKLSILSNKQESFQKEISSLRTEIESLKKPLSEAASGESKPTAPVEKNIVVPPEKIEVKSQIPSVPPVMQKPVVPPMPPKPIQPKAKSDIEKFIGENLISKIGIIITVIGVAIGAKYAIDHQLISPVTRIILGYIAGLVLLGFAIRLKKDYENFSAVLLSGAVAIMYFITYAAYILYDLIPQVVSFAMMVLFTIFTVAAAINYNKQVIAHIGLVGAYAVPLLLSEGSGRVAVLFSYMAIVNTGILFIAFKKYWKPLYYSSFFITWLIYFLWYGAKYQTAVHFSLALIFLSVFSVIFYLTFLSYKLVRKEKFDAADILLLLLNSFIFYGIGYSILDNHTAGKELLGLFTIVNALVHFIVSLFIYKDRLVDRNLFYFVSSLVLVFITIAFPVQLDGNWVTLFWVAEAALLFWIGRTKNVWAYELLSYLLMIISFFSIVQDWADTYGAYSSVNHAMNITPLFNIHFLSSLFFVASFSFIVYLNRRTKLNSDSKILNNLFPVSNIMMTVILLLTIYFSFTMEINIFFHRLYLDSGIKMRDAELDFNFTQQDYDIHLFKDIWVINYSLLFLTVLSIVNIRKFRSRLLGFVNLGFNALWILIFLVYGFYLLSLLRDSYLNQTLSEYYYRGIFHILIRYISLIFVVAIIMATYKYIKQDFLKINLRMPFDFLLHLSVLWIISSEFINWMNIFHSTKSYKLGLSILWGVYALVVIILGIIHKKKYLRIAAIVLFGFTLLKLFVYDIAHLDTIAKTIVFVSLGILLLSISFLYNKYKHVIFDEQKS
ncbi:MAG: DUF2339 domain-containing protein [bacterium]